MTFTKRFLTSGSVMLLLMASIEQRALADDPVFFSRVEEVAIDPRPLLGGRPADPMDFPASFISRSGGKWCSGTLVGAGVFLTAAHCLSGRLTIKLVAGGASYSGECEVAKDYLDGDVSADWALCNVPEYPSVLFEVVNVDPARLIVGNDLLLVGFGCALAGGSKGILRYGYAPIETLPTSSNHYVVARGDVAVCFGDSGNAAFLPVMGTDLRRRYQVGVNSRGNIYDMSAISSTSAGPGVSFMRDWIARHGREICGLSIGAVGCRPL